MFYAMTWTATKLPPKGAAPEQGADAEDDDASEQCQEEQYDRSKIRRLLLLLILIPAVFSLCMFIVGTYASDEYVPLSLDVHLWRNFSAHVKRSVHALDSKYPHNILLSLFAVHAIQVLLCFPLMHVTKIMYGYFFGTWAGGGISSAWELFLICVFLLVATQNLPVRPPSSDLAGFLQYVSSLRARKLLLLFLVCLHMSSVPLVTSTCLVLFQVVTRSEFLLTHVCATALTTYKDTWLGHFLASSDGNANNIAIAATLLSVSALLPTVLTVSLMGFVGAAAAKKSSEFKATQL